MRVAVVPSAPALLPAYAGLSDPLAEVRAAALEACAWLLADARSGVHVLADDLGCRVGTALLAVHGAEPTAPGRGGDAILVVADGTARRGEKAPGHLDERAAPYDEVIGRALATGDAATLASLDRALGAELLAGGVGALRTLGDLLAGLPVRAEVDYQGDPFGVAYWVARWEVADEVGSA